MPVLRPTSYNMSHVNSHISQIKIECPAKCLAPLLSLEGRRPVRREDLDPGDGGPIAGRLTRAVAFRRPPDRNQHGGGEV